MFSRAPVAFVGLVFLLACTGEPESEVTPGDEPSVRISQGTDLLSLDPYARLESPSFCIQRNIFEPLTDYDQNIDLQPCLAESWRYETPTSWLFELRKGVVFQEGQPFTAQDVVFSIRRALDWPLTRVSSEILSIDTVQKVDTHTVRITTHDPDAILPLRLAMILMLDRESTEPMIQEHGQAWLATHANGTGPYRVEDWTRDVQCVLRANETYRNGPPEVKRLEFVPMANDATRMAALERGNIDIMVHVPPRYANRIEAMPDHRLVRQPGMRLIYLGLDVGRDRSPGVPASPPNPLKDRRVRRAMALAIDNRLIVEKIMAGHAVPADQLFPEPVTGYDPTIEPVGTHLERARGLLAEAGYPQGFRIRLDGPNDRYVNDEQILQAVAAQLGRVGIQVMVNAQPKARFFSEEEQGRCSFFLLGWSNTNGDGAATFEHLLHTRASDGARGVRNTCTHYSNPRLDRLTRQAAREFDAGRRAELLRQAHRIAMRDLVHIPLHIQMDLYAVSDRVRWMPRRDTQVRGLDIRLIGKH